MIRVDLPHKIEVISMIKNLEHDNKISITEESKKIDKKIVDLLYHFLVPISNENEFYNITEIEIYSQSDEDTFNDIIVDIDSEEEVILKATIELEKAEIEIYSQSDEDTFNDIIVDIDSEEEI